MISGTYLVSGVLLIISAQLFKAGALSATAQTICWAVIFFFASAGASAGYLAVDAEGKALEDITQPLSVVAKPAEAVFRADGAPGPLPSPRD
jgi:hypothetical protein